MWRSVHPLSFKQSTLHKKVETLNVDGFIFLPFSFCTRVLQLTRLEGISAAMSNSTEPEAKQEMDNSRTQNMEDENIQTFPVETLAEERPTNHYDVTGDSSHFSATETGALENHYPLENRKDNTDDAADYTSGDHFSGQDVEFGDSRMNLGEYGGIATQLNGGDAYKREEEGSEHAEDRNGQLRNLQPSDMNYDGHSCNTSNWRINAGASFGIKDKNLAGEDQAGYDNRGNERTNSLGENGPYYVSAPVRGMFDGSRVPEPDDSQIVDTREGADNIPGVDDLPIFANDQSKALNDEIKVISRSRLYVHAEVRMLGAILV